MSFEKSEVAKEQFVGDLEKELLKADDAVNHSGLRKPTEYSASID